MTCKGTPCSRKNSIITFRTLLQRKQHQSDHNLMNLYPSYIHNPDKQGRGLLGFRVIMVEIPLKKWPRKQGMVPQSSQHSELLYVFSKDKESLYRTVSHRLSLHLMDSIKPEIRFNFSIKRPHSCKLQLANTVRSIIQTDLMSPNALRLDFRMLKMRFCKANNLPFPG